MRHLPSALIPIALGLCAVLGLPMLCIGIVVLSEERLGPPPSLRVVSEARQRWLLAASPSQPATAIAQHLPAGAPVLQPAEAISEATVTRLTELARWGYGVVTDIAWSPDGLVIAAASEAGVALIDAATLTEAQFFEELGGATSAAFAPDGQLLAAGLADHSVKVWRVADRQLIFQGAHSDSVTDISFSADSSLVVSASADMTVRLWDVNAGVVTHMVEAEQPRFGEHNYPAQKALVVPDSEKLVVELRRVNPETTPFSYVSTVIVWDIVQAAPLYRWDDARYPTVSADGQRLATIDAEGVRVRSLVDGKVVMEVALPPGGIGNATISPDGKLVAVVLGNHVDIRRVSDGSTAQLIQLGSRISRAEFAPDSARIATVSGGIVSTWDVGTGERLVVAMAQPGNTDRYIALSADERLLAVGSGQDVGIWDVAGGRLTDVFGGFNQDASIPDWINGVTVDMQHSLMAVSVSDGTLHLRDIETGEGRGTISTNWPAHSVRFSPDGKQVAAVTGDSVQLWRVGDGQLLHQFQGVAQGGIPGYAYGGLLAFSPDGKIVAARLVDRQIRLWRLTDGAPLPGFPLEVGDPLDLAFAPDGRSVATLSGAGVEIWSVQTGELLVRKPLLADGAYRTAYNLLFSPDGRLLFAASGSELWVIRAADGALIRRHDVGHSTQGISSMVLSRDGRVLFLGMRDGTIRLWGIP